MQKGFFASAVALALLFSMLLLNSQRVEIEKQRMMAQTAAIEAENASFLRTQTELNLDYLIGKTIEEELLAKNFEAQKIKQKIAERITEYAVEQPKEENGVSIEFFIEKNLQEIPPDPIALTEITQVVVISGEKIVAAEFVFTGGLNRSSDFKAKISGKNFSTEFMLPKGYSIKKAVVVA